MTLNIDAWLSTGIQGQIDAAQWASDLWAIIQRDPKTVILNRDGIDLAEQTCRIVEDNSGNMTNHFTGVVSNSKVKIYGVKGHPDVSISDFNVRIGDEFWYENSQYRINALLTPPGQIQAIGERISKP